MPQRTDKPCLKAVLQIEIPETVQTVHCGIDRRQTPQVLIVETVLDHRGRDRVIERGGIKAVARSVLDHIDRADGGGQSTGLIRRHLPDIRNVHAGAGNQIAVDVNQPLQAERRQQSATDIEAATHGIQPAIADGRPCTQGSCVGAERSR